MDHQNLSEHVLCMVLYLIELGLENSPEQESDEEVRTNILFFKIQRYFLMIQYSLKLDFTIGIRINHLY